MPTPATTIDLPASVQGRACFHQFVGALAVEQAYFDQAAAQIQQIGMETIWKANEANPPGLYNPGVFALAAALATQGKEVKLAGAEANTEFTDENGVPAYAISKGTAIIPVNGPLSKQSSSLNSMFGGSNTVGMRKALGLAMADPRVERVMFHIDSPGGTVAGTGDLGDDIFAASHVKPIASYIEDMGTSAAYWIASQTSEVYASPYANVGSIGVIWTVYDRSGQAEKAGIRVHAITSNPGKAFAVDGMPISKAQFAKMQAHVDGIYQNFVSVVARGRGVTYEEARAMSGDADVMPAKEALQKGLIDAIASFGDALTRFSNVSVKRLKVEPAHAPIRSTAITETLTVTEANIVGATTGLEASATVEVASDAGGSGFSIPSAMEVPEETIVSPEPNPAGKTAAAPVSLPAEEHAALLAKAELGAKAHEEILKLRAEQAAANTARLAARRERLVAEFPQISKEAAAKCTSDEALDALESVARAGSNQRTGADPASAAFPKAVPTAEEETQKDIAEWQAHHDAQYKASLGGN